MRLERERCGGSQLRWCVVPDPVEQLLAPPQSAVQRLQEPALAVEPVADVFVELRVRIPDDRPVAWAERLELERAEPPQGLQVAGEGTATGRGEDASLTKHGVAAAQHCSAEEGDVIGRVPRGRKLLQATEPCAVAE